MTNKMMTFRQMPRMVCAWRMTGDSKTPLACAWFPAVTSAPASITLLPAETDEGGMRLCA